MNVICQWRHILSHFYRFPTQFSTITSPDHPFLDTPYNKHTNSCLHVTPSPRLACTMLTLSFYAGVAHGGSGWPYFNPKKERVLTSSDAILAVFWWNMFLHFGKSRSVGQQVIGFKGAANRRPVLCVWVKHPSALTQHLDLQIQGRWRI